VRPCGRHARIQQLEVLPGLLALARQALVTSFERGDPEGDELKALLEACVVSAYRLRLRERLRAMAGAS
jgi:hypothetical protein